MRSLLGAAFLAAMLTSVAMSQNADLADAVSRTQEKLDDVQAKTGTIDKLMDAVRRNDAEGIKNVIAGATDADTEVKHISGDGKTLLHFAAIWPSGTNPTPSSPRTLAIRPLELAVLVVEPNSEGGCLVIRRDANNGLRNPSSAKGGGPTVRGFCSAAMDNGLVFTFCSLIKRALRLS